MTRSHTCVLSPEKRKDTNPKTIWDRSVLPPLKHRQKMEVESGHGMSRKIYSPPSLRFYETSKFKFKFKFKFKSKEFNFKGHISLSTPSHSTPGCSYFRAGILKTLRVKNHVARGMCVVLAPSATLFALRRTDLFKHYVNSKGK